MTAKFRGRPVSRREALRLGGAALASGLTGLSGCSGLPPLGSAVRYGSVDAPTQFEAPYRKWLPVPATLPDDSGFQEGYDVMAYAPDDDLAAAPSVPRGIIVWLADYVGLHVDDCEVAFAAGDVAVLAGRFDRAAIRETIADTRYEPDGSYGGYDLFSRADVPRIAGVGAERILFASGEHAGSDLRAVVDAHAGDRPLYVDRNPDFDALTASAGLGQWAWVVPGDDSSGYGDARGVRADTVGWATSFDVDGRGVYLVETWLFPEGYDVTEGQVKASLTERGRAVESSAVDVSVSGRVATVEMHLPRGLYRDQFEVGSFRVPHVTWGVTHDADAGRLTFHHEAGDAVRTDSLRVRTTGSAEPAASVESLGDHVAPGEDLTVSTADVESGTTVRLVYVSHDGDTTAALIDYDLP